MHAGSTHDSTVFMSTPLYTHLSKSEQDGGLPAWCHVAADKAYGNGAAGGHILTAYSGNLTPRQDAFNFYLSSLRILVVQAFGVIVGRFDILWSPMRCTLLKAALIVVACCKIHNFIIDRRIAREGDEIDHGAGLPAVSDPLKGVSGKS
jgi:DDE superfamily endonuclease